MAVTMRSVRVARPVVGDVLFVPLWGSTPPPPGWTEAGHGSGRFAYRVCTGDEPVRDDMYAITPPTDPGGTAVRV